MEPSNSDETLSLSKLRGKLFTVVDEVIATGKPVEIERNGHRVRLVLVDEPTGRLARVHGHAGNVLCDPDDLISPLEFDWNEERKIRS